MNTDMKEPAVTILLPVYNSAETLQATLDSLFAQQFEDFELLVVDDGSTDQSPDILQACHDPRLRVLKNPERLRLAGALNRGLQEAAAPLIARMDADDLCRPDRLNRQLAFMDAHPEIALCGSWTRHFGDRKKNKEAYPVSADAIRAFALFNCPFAHPTVMFRRALFLEEQLLYDGSFYPTEDYELWTRLVHRFPCANVPEILLDYRVHAKSMTGSDWDNMDAQACRLMKNQFAGLGVVLDDKQVRLHRDIGMARVSAEEMEAAAAHLGLLLQLNQEKEFCSSEAFAREVEERWFHVCMNVRGLARAGFYQDARIWGGRKPPLPKRGLLKASVMREGWS